MASKKQEVLGSPVSSNGEWEILDNSLFQAKNVETDNECGYSKVGDNKRLCGFLWKLGSKGIIKGWKHRWFVFDGRRCMLYYYSKPNDADPLGNIDIANSTFSFSPDEKALFEISTGSRRYSLQAEDKTTMMFWLQELQIRRRAHVNKTNNEEKATNGLLGVTEEKKDEQKVEDLLGLKIEKPSTVGEHAANQKMEHRPWNLSFANINTELKNWRKSNIVPTGQPIALGKSSLSVPCDMDKIGTANQPESRKLDFGISRMLSSIRSAATADISLPIQERDESACLDCQEIKSTIEILKEAIAVAEKEITTRDDVINNLHEQIRCVSQQSRPSSSETAEDKEQYIQKLSRLLKKANEDIESLKLALSEKDTKCEEYAEKELVLKTMMHAKDNSIVLLTNRILQLESDVADDVIDVTEETPTALTSLMRNEHLSYIQLQESIEAIRLQNNFLNSEILELNNLRSKDADRINELIRERDNEKAEQIKLKSRYLWLLKEFSSPKRDGSSNTTQAAEMVEHLLDEAINETQDSSQNAEQPKLADRYGFYGVYDKNDDESLENFVDYFDSLSNNNEDKISGVSIGVKWENFLVAQGTAPLERNEELKGLVRCGVPHEYRARVWSDLINSRVGGERDLLGAGYYAALLKEKRGSYTPASKQIELDLLRTLPNNRFYDTIDAQGTTKLRRVLLAYSWHNPSVGYCQGLNRLGAIALLYLDEESAFWCLVAIVEHLMPLDYYSHSLLGAQIDQRVFRDLLEEKFPRISSHLQTMQFDISLISFNWFLTVFVDFFPTELCLRVWDAFLFEGSKVLFRFAIAVFRLFEDDILKCRDAGPVFAFFRKVPRSRFNVQKLWNVAFVELNPFGRKSIEAKRRFHRPQLQGELDFFEDLRKDYGDKKRSDSIPPNSDEDL